MPGGECRQALIAITGMGRYKSAGIFLKQREERKWILVLDGEEFPFFRRHLAVLSAKAAMERYPDLKLFEETVIHTRTGCFRLPDKKFRIDITNELNYPNF